MASSFASKLGRLPSLAPAATEPAPSLGEDFDVSDLDARARGKPSLDDLRSKIARILAREPAAPERVASERRRASDASSWIEHTFAREETALGPLHRSSKPTPPGQRVGAVPVWTARNASAALLALLALDPALAACDPARALYLDTETTGLAGGTGTVPFLVGLGFFDARAGSFVVEQGLLRTFGEEAALLEHLRRRVEDASMLVTFNGKSFDWPLLRTRAVMNRLPPLPERPHLDLLHVARRLHRHRLASCSLGCIEDEVLGQQRVGDVCGADIAAIYHHYVRTGDLWALEPVVEHNVMDVVSMFALVGLYGEPLGGAFGAATEPGSGCLLPTDLAAFAQVTRRAGDLDRARAFADASIERGGGALGFKARGDVAKARGDKAAALLDYERALIDAEVLEQRRPRSVPLAFREATFASGPGGESGGRHVAAAVRETTVAPVLRLELAKLYEHHARSFDKALQAMARGTSELPAQHERRMRRVTSKRDKKKVAATPFVAGAKLK